MSSVRPPILPKSSVLSPVTVTSFFNHSFTSLNCNAFKSEQYSHFSVFSDSKPNQVRVKTDICSKQAILKQDPLNFKKTYSSEKVKLFIQKIEKKGIMIEPKVDGFACLLEYENGNLINALTKHDRLNSKVNYINRLSCVPKKLKMNFSGFIRGELFVSHRAFQSINNRRVKYRLEIYKDALGVLVSSFLRKTGDKFVDNNIQFFGYYMQYFGKQPYVQSQLDVHCYLKKLGFKCDLTSKFRIFKNTKKAMEYITDVKNRRCSCSAPIDGMVVKALHSDVPN